MFIIASSSPSRGHEDAMNRVPTTGVGRFNWFISISGSPTRYYAEWLMEFVVGLEKIGEIVV
jgi:hypothetical protein